MRLLHTSNSPRLVNLCQADREKSMVLAIPTTNTRGGGAESSNSGASYATAGMVKAASNLAPTRSVLPSKATSNFASSSIPDDGSALPDGRAVRRVHRVQEQLDPDLLAALPHCGQGRGPTALGLSMPGHRGFDPHSQGLRGQIPEETRRLHSTTRPNPFVLDAGRVPERLEAPAGGAGVFRAHAPYPRASSSNAGAEDALAASQRVRRVAATRPPSISCRENP